MLCFSERINDHVSSLIRCFDAASPIAPAVAPTGAQNTQSSSYIRTTYKSTINDNLSNAMHFNAICRNYSEAVECALKDGANANAVHVGGREHSMPFLIASFRDHDRIVRILLLSGVYA